MPLSVTFKCPVCQSVIRPAQIHVDWGSGPGFECPSCKGWLRFSRAHTYVTFVISLLVTGAILIVSGIEVHMLSGLLLAALLIFVAVAFVVNAVAGRLWPPRLEASFRRGAVLELFGGKRR